jgi:membrane protease YdiL (CAAX protease family)
MLRPCPHCDQQVVPDEHGQCPLCHGVIPAPADQFADEAFSEELDVIAVQAVPAENDSPGDQQPGKAQADTTSADGAPPASPAPADALDISNPYASPQAADPAVTAALAQPMLAPPRSHPHPGFWGAIGLLLAVWLVQIIGGVVFMVVVISFNLLEKPFPELAREPEALQRALMEGSSGAVFFLTASGSVLALGVLLGLLYGRAALDKLALRRFTAVQLLLVLLTVLPANLLAVQAMVAFTQLMPQDVALVPDLDFAGVGWPVMIVAICVFPGIAEEVVFRGIIGRGLKARYGITTGVLITSLLFGVAHIFPAQALFAFLAGILLHLVFLSTRSLWAPMLLHALNNGLALAMYALRDHLHVPGYTDHDVSGFVAWPVLASSLAVLAAIGWSFYWARTRYVLSDGSEWSPGYFSLERPPQYVGAKPHNQGMHVALLLLVLLLYTAFIASLLWAGGMVEFVR